MLNSKNRECLAALPEALAHLRHRLLLAPPLRQVVSAKRLAQAAVFLAPNPADLERQRRQQLPQPVLVSAVRPPLNRVVFSAPKIKPNKRAPLGNRRQPDLVQRNQPLPAVYLALKRQRRPASAKPPRQRSARPDSANKPDSKTRPSVCLARRVNRPDSAEALEQPLLVLPQRRHLSVLAQRAPQTRLRHLELLRQTRPNRPLDLARRQRLKRQLLAPPERQPDSAPPLNPRLAVFLAPERPINRPDSDLAQPPLSLQPDSVRQPLALLARQLPVLAPLRAVSLALLMPTNQNRCLGPVQQVKTKKKSLKHF